MEPGGVRRAVQLVAGGRRIIALSGAGLSTPSGIPDFRSPTSGLWNQIDAMQVASIWAFRTNPVAFYTWFAPLGRAIRAARPNAAHTALVELEQMGKLRSLITQNIDGLHQSAGSRRVLELHGHIREAVCMSCRKTVPASGPYEDIVCRGEVPHCKACDGVLKPAVVLYGEPLAQATLREAQAEALSCDVLLVAGCSLEVAPACDLPLMARRAGARLIIVNYETTPLDDVADVVVHDDVSRVLPALVTGLRG